MKIMIKGIVRSVGDVITNKDFKKQLFIIAIPESKDAFDRVIAKEEVFEVQSNPTKYEPADLKKLLGRKVHISTWLNCNKFVRSTGEESYITQLNLNKVEEIFDDKREEKEYKDSHSIEPGEDDMPF